MLHLFNKVYLEFDDKIDLNFDRIVISQRYAIEMYKALDNISNGILISYGKTYDDVVKESFVGFISSYKRLITQWFTTIFPMLDLETFKILFDYTIYNQRVTSNTQLSSVHSVSLKTMWEGIGQISTYWRSVSRLTSDEVKTFKELDLKLSYEFLIANYFSGNNTEYTEKLRSTMHLFLRRWFVEVFTDNRQMVLLNLSNHKFREAMGIDAKDIDITSTDPLANIPQLSAYADDIIWERNEEFTNGIFGECALAGISEEQSNALIDTLIGIYTKFEGMDTDRSMFQVVKEWLPIATRDTVTDAELEIILEYIINNPFDTNLIPKFSFETVNFPLFLYFLDLKFRGGAFNRFKLI
jgi:hypothetical protein